MAIPIYLTGITTDIDVVSKYNELIKENLGSESLYIRMKETLQDMFDSGIIKDSDRAPSITAGFQITGFSGKYGRLFELVSGSTTGYQIQGGVTVNTIEL